MELKSRDLLHMQNGYELDISLRRLCNVKTTGRRDAPTPVVTDRQM